MIIGIPVLRLRGDYLAIVTLAFGEIIKNIINMPLYWRWTSQRPPLSASNAGSPQPGEGGKLHRERPDGRQAGVTRSPPSPRALCW